MSPGNPKVAVVAGLDTHFEPVTPVCTEALAGASTASQYPESTYAIGIHDPKDGAHDSFHDFRI